ncbi:hypothetical protein VR010_12895 [Actinomycetaceae bacterium L2_0104]
METIERLTTARKILMQAEAAVGLDRAHPPTYGAHALQISQNDGAPEEPLPEGREPLPDENAVNAGGRPLAVQDSAFQPAAWSTQMGWSVPASLTGVLPHGLRRGMTLSVRGSRLASLLLAGLASSQGAWVACIGIPDMSWGMALLLGMDFDRVILVPEYRDRVLPQAISTAIDGFDVVVVGQRVFLDSREKRLLSRRALSRKVLLIAEGWESREQVQGQLAGVEGPRGGSGHINALNLDMSRPGGRPCRVAVTQRGWQTREVVRSVPRLDTDGAETSGARLGSMQGASVRSHGHKNGRNVRGIGENLEGNAGKAMGTQRALKVVLS